MWQGRRHFRIAALAALALRCLGQEAWQTSFLEYYKALDTCVRNTSCDASSILSNKEIRWEARYDGISTQANGQIDLKLSMFPHLSVMESRFGAQYLRGFGAAPPAAGDAPWRALAAGAPVRFRASILTAAVTAGSYVPFLIGCEIVDEPAPWQTDWERFLDELTPYFETGEGLFTIATRFETRTVVWEGVLESTSGTTIGIRMTSRRVAIGRNGSPSERRFLIGIVPSAGELAQWRQIPLGTRVRVNGSWDIMIPTSTALEQFFITIKNAPPPAVGPSVAASNPVVNAASFTPGIAPLSWFTVRGAGLSNTTRTWRDSDFAGGKLPKSLDGVSVKVNGKDAAIYYISPGQINSLVPDDDATGAVEVAVNSPGGQVRTTASLQRHAPAFFLFDPENRKYVAAVHPDGALAGKAGLFGSEAPTRPLPAGGRALLFGTGFGPTNPAVAGDEVFQGAAPLRDAVTIGVGGAQATVEFAGLVGAGLYQFNIIVPNLPDGDHAVVAQIGGVASPANAFLTIGSTQQAARITASPASLAAQAQVGTAPAPLSVSVTSSGGTLSFTAEANIAGGASWLRVSPLSATTPATLTATVSIASLGPGTYNGTIRITAAGASNSPLAIPVTLTVLPAGAGGGSYTISTYAGNGSGTSSGDGGPATSASLYYPYGVAVDAAGNVYIAELNGNRVRKVTRDGVISTYAGNGRVGNSGDSGQATAAQLFQPAGLAVDRGGNLYIAEVGHRVRKVTPDGIISTFVGGANGGNTGDGGPAGEALLNSPQGLAFDAAGNLYIAELGGGRVRKVDAGGTVSTVISGLDRPDNVAVDPAGNLYIAEFTQIRKLSPAGESTINYTKLKPFVAADGRGNVYLSDNNTGTVIQVSPSGAQTTIAGTGAGGFSGDGGLATRAQLLGVRSMAFDASGAIYIAEWANNRVRKLTPVALPVP